MSTFKFSEDIEKVLSEAMDNYEQAKEFINECKYNEAITLLKTTLKDVKKIRPLENTEYFSFDELFQFDMYISFYAKSKDTKGKHRKKTNRMTNIQWCTAPIDKMYLHLGYTLVETGALDQALNTLRSGLKWNPCSVDLRFEAINILKTTGGLDKALDALLDIHKYIYRPEDLARFYRDLSYIFIENTKWKEAIASLFLSANFTDDEKDLQRVENELGYIESTSGTEITYPSDDEILKVMQEHKIPIGINDKLLDLAQYRFEQSLESNNKEWIKYYQEIYYNFVVDTNEGDDKNFGK